MSDRITEILPKGARKMLIAIEGLDGSGKGTQSEILVNRLRSEGYSVNQVDFPDYKSEGSVPVRLYLNGELGKSVDSVNAYAASMLFCTDRFVSWKMKWEREYLSSDVTVANRYTTANAYHQLSKLPREEWDSFLRWMWELEFDRVGLPRPELVICLLNPPEAAISLIEKRCRETGVKKDIHEADEKYLYRCYEAAKYVGEKCGWVMLDCVDESGEIISRERMHEAIYAHVRPILMTGKHNNIE